MSEPDLPPTRSVAVYNPDLLSKEELIAHFVARRPLLEHLVEDIRSATLSGGHQHHLVVGQRGMGKTTLLRRLRYAVQDDPELGRVWLPLTFPEEQYNVARLSDLYMNCADALGDALESLGQRERARTIDAALNAIHGLPEAKRAASALDLLLASADGTGKRLLLLVDSVELILDRLHEEQWTIRELLSSEKRLLLVGASAEAMESTYNYGKAFYDFFRVHELRGLTEEETRDVLQNLATADNAQHVLQLLRADPGRIRALHVLTGGNPRTVVLLYRVLAHDSDGDVRTDLEQLLDLCTPLYKSRFEALPAQSQQIVDALARKWDPQAAGELADIVQLDVNAVSSQLNRLVQQGVVEKVAYHPSTKTGFQIAERFFNIWYLMRASRRLRERLVWLGRFLRLMYGDEELGLRARRLLLDASPRSSLATRHSSEWGLAVAQALDEGPLRRALESDAIRRILADAHLRPQLLTVVDLDGADADLRPHVEGAQWAAELREAVLKSSPQLNDAERQRFLELLGGCPSLSRSSKLQLARVLESATATACDELHNRLQRERNKTVGLVGAPATAALYAALLRGLMRAAGDVDDAQAAAIVLEMPQVLAAAAIWRSVMAPLSEVKSFDPLVLFGVHATEGNALLALATANWLSRLGRHTEAESVYRQCLAADDSMAPAWFGLGTLLWNQPDRPDEAEAALRNAAQRNPDNPRTWLFLGRLLDERLGRPSEAEAPLRKAAELDPADADAWLALGTLLGKSLRQPREAEIALRRAIELRPKWPVAWNNLGNVLGEHLGRHDESEHAYRRAIEIDASYPLAWIGLGNLLQDHRGHYDEAESSYRTAIHLNPSIVNAWSGLGLLLGEHLGRHEEAEAALRKATELAPAWSLPWTNLGAVLYRTGRNNGAEGACRKAIELGPVDAVSWNNLGVVLTKQPHQVAEAEAACRKAIELDGIDSRPWNNLGILLSQDTSRVGEAEASFRRALELRPAEQAYWKNLGRLLQSCKRRSEAALAYREAATLAPSDPDAWNGLAWNRFLSGVADNETEAAGRQAAQLAPDDVNVAHTLATILVSRGKWIEALPHARRFIQGGDAEFVERAWPDIVAFFREAVRTGHARDAGQLLDELGMGEQWRPLCEALTVLAADDPTLLLRVAPEIRQPAEELLRRLTPAVPLEEGALAGAGRVAESSGSAHRRGRRLLTSTRARGKTRMKRQPRANGETPKPQRLRR